MTAKTSWPMIKPRDILCVIRPTTSSISHSRGKECFMMRPVTEPPRCAGCDAELAAGDRICWRCGKAVEGPLSEAQPDRFANSGAYSILVAFIFISAALGVVYRVIQKRELTQTYA